MRLGLSIIILSPLAALAYCYSLQIALWVIGR
jgi:hypothetical protein